LAPLLFPAKIVILGIVAKESLRRVAEIENTVSSMDLPASGPLRLAVLWSDDPLTLINAPYMRDPDSPAGLRTWRDFWTFSAVNIPETVRRVDARTIQLSTPQHFFATDAEVIMRGGKRPHLGDSVRFVRDLLRGRLPVRAGFAARQPRGAATSYGLLAPDAGVVMP